jgi:hypothetical protein
VALIQRHKQHIQDVDAKRGSPEGSNLTAMCTLTLLRKVQVFQEISQKKAFAEQQLVIVRQQKVARTREGRMLQLTSSEVSSLPADTKVYEGVGKMSVFITRP